MNKPKIRTESITSRSNPAIAEAALLRDKKGRSATGLLTFDGVKLCREYLLTGHIPERVFVREDVLSSVCDMIGEIAGNGNGGEKGESQEIRLYSVPSHVFERLTDEHSPDGVVTVVRTDTLPSVRLTEGARLTKDATDGRTMILASMRDPGNVGTVLRTALAFGFSRVMMSSDCADVFSPKTVRASMGAVFRLSTVVCDDLKTQILCLRDSGRRVFAAELRQDALPADDACITPDDIIVIGNEGHGIPSDVSAACTGSVFLPISPEAESLNAAVAAAVFLYRQRNV